MEKPDLASTFKPQSRFVMALGRFRSNTPAVVGLAVLIALVLVAAIGPMIWPYGHTELTPDLSKPPSFAHPLGTDTLGRDMLALVMRGMQQSLLIAGSVALMASVIGTTLGIIAGYFGRYVDASVMRLVDLVLTIPTIALAAFLGNAMSNFGVSWIGLSLVLGALFWTSVARLVRGVSLSLREMQFIKAAQVMGAGPIRIMARHMVPNVADHIIVATALLIGVAILSETALSFLGFGVRPPDTSLGLLISNAQTAVLTRPWLFYAPGLLIILIVLSINYVGEGLRDAFNPKAALTNPLITRKAVGSVPQSAVQHPDALISIRDYTVRFPGSGAAAVDAISLAIRQGEVLALVGESGSGKSLTSLAIAGLLPVGAGATGHISFRGKPVDNLSFDQWRAFRGRRIATILQDPSTSLNPVLTIESQFHETFATAGPISKAESRKRAVELLELMAIRDPESRLDQYPHQMSGGIRQRIVIAMAMIHKPDLIIADEPTTALDVTVQAQVLDALKVARERIGAAMLFITHDLALVAGVADRVAVMRHGQIVEERNVVELFADPQADYTKMLLSLAPRLDQLEFCHEKADRGDQPVLLQVNAVSKHFQRPRAGTPKGGDRTIHALCGVSFELRAGETLGIVGESGSGKTTLLNTILGLYLPDHGKVIFDGHDLRERSARRAVGRDISVVFQDPYSSLDPRMTVQQLLCEPLEIYGFEQNADARVRQVLEQVRLPVASLDRFPHEFSGGQRQRIAIARALMLNPRLVILDEPVSALDVSIQQDILRLLGELKSELDIAYLLVAHDLAVVAELSDRIGVMYGGQLVELGATRKIITAPAHPYTKILLDAVPIPDPGIERERRNRAQVTPWPTAANPLPACPTHQG